MENRKFIGSICLTDLNAKGKEMHPALKKGKNGKFYLNIVMWVNKEPDKFGNTHSIQLHNPKDSDLPVSYIGNLKPSEYEEAKVNKDDVKDLGDDLPFDKF